MASCMEAVKLSSTWTLSFSFHSLYWVVEGRVARGAEVEGGGTVGNREPSSGLSVGAVAAATAAESLSSIFVLLGLLFLGAKGHVLKFLTFRLVVKDTILVLTHENQLKNKDSASLSKSYNWERPIFSITF